MEDEIVNGKVELWLKHPDIDRIEVSSFGRVRSVNGHYYKINPINSGYLKTQFHTNGKHVNKFVHRLVAQAFIPNPNDLPEVNHKDGDRANNNVDNLEWCTREENIAYREKFGKASNRPVFATNLTTLEVLWFPSQSEAGRELGVSQSSVSSVITGKYKQECGYWFVSADDKAVDIVKQNLHDIGKTGLKI